MFLRRRWSLSSSATRHGESPKHHRDKKRDRHRRHSKQRDPPPEERIIDLIDLDYSLTSRRRATGLIQDTTQLCRVAEHLKTKYPNGAQRIPKDAEVQFFWNNTRLDGNDIPKEASTLRYRVLPVGDDGSLRIEWKGANLRLHRDQLDTIANEVAAGRSVGSIRQTIVDLVRMSNKVTKDIVQSPNQVVIEMTGGLRPGPLEGNSWEAHKAQELWLCRHLTIDLKRPTRYLVLKGFNEEYVWHKPYVNSHGYVDAYDIKQWLINALMAVGPSGVCRRGIGVIIDMNDIRLTVRGKLLGKHSFIRPGKTVEFDVPRVVEEKFLRAEARLVPLTETCNVCSDEKRVSEMPNRRLITASCEHDSSICKDCVGQWIASSMDTLTWDRLKCPECPQLLKYHNVQAFAPRDVFDRYDTLATRALLSSLAEFMWCLNPKCDSGQIHPTGCSKAKCFDCKQYLCVQHHVPWHSGETCDEYERRTRRQRKNDKASEKHVKEIAKPCPGCKKMVYKFVGCDHVTCICRHEWCWLCFGKYYLDNNGLLQCSHTEQCRYHDNPPNYEGGRAFMPFLDPFFDQRGPNMNRAMRPRQGPPPNPNAAAAAPPRAPLRVPVPPRFPPLDLPPPPRPLLEDDIFRNFNVRRRHIDRPQHIPPPNQNLDFFDDAMLFNLGQLMQRAGRGT